MSLDEAADFFQVHFQLLSQRITGKNYAIRFFAPPYDDTAPDKLIYTDHRNPTLIDRESIISVLEKFGITQERFRDAYNEFNGGKTATA